MIGITLPLKSRALTQYTGLPVTGVAMLENKVLVATDEGIHVLDSAVSDNGTAISAYFRSVNTDFGMHNRKRVRSLFLRAFAQRLNIKMLTEDFEYTSSFIQEEGYIRGRRDRVGTYWQFEISNVGGDDFSIDAVDIQIVPQQKTKARMPAVFRVEEIYARLTVPAFIVEAGI